MTILKAGDIRKKGDEQRRATGHPYDYEKSFHAKYPEEFLWRPADLIGHAILQSDLIVLEFRRP